MLCGIGYLLLATRETESHEAEAKQRKRSGFWGALCKHSNATQWA